MSLYFLSYINLISNIFFIKYDTTYYQLIFVFFIMPLIELFIPFPQQLLVSTKKTKINDFLLYAWYPFEILFLLLHIYYKRYSFFDSIVLGLIFGLGINVAHELIHKNSKIDKFFGRRLLELTFYGFWEWQHLYCHHKNVGFDKDPATAPLGMSVYFFIPRSIYGTIRQAFQLSPGKFYTSIQKSILILGITAMLDCPIFYLRSCLIGIAFLEIINYIEHYGLSRQLNEKVKEEHSWDAPFVFSSFFLFKLPLHSDHHLHSFKPYSELQVLPKSPKLPYSYPIMIILSFLPPLYFYILHNND